MLQFSHLVLSGVPDVSVPEGFWRVSALLHLTPWKRERCVLWFRAQCSMLIA